MTEQTEEQIAKTKAAIDAMRNAQKNMGAAISRIETLEKALRDASHSIIKLKTYIPDDTYQYMSDKKCKAVADHAIQQIATVLG